MAERERSRDRRSLPLGHQTSSSASGTGPFAFFNQFLPSNAKSGRSRAALSTRDVKEEVVMSEPLVQPRPFHLENAIKLMNSSETHDPSLVCEVVRETAAYIGNQDVFNDGDIIDFGQVKRLYTCVTTLLAAKLDTPLDTASIRLLTALLTSLPLPVTEAVIDHSMHLRQFYGLVTNRMVRPNAELVLAQVFAVTILTDNGKNVDEMDGIVGWLLRSMGNIIEEWTTWCKQDETFDEEAGSFTIAAAIPAEAPISIVLLLSSIVSHHAPFFSPADLARIVQTLLDFFSSGIDAAATSENQYPPASVHIKSPLSPPSNCPVPARLSDLGITPSGHRSRAEAKSSQSTPTQRAPIRRSTSSTATSSPQYTSHLAPIFFVRWTQILPSFCSFLKMLVEDMVLPDELFAQVMAFICLCFGQDDVDSMPQHGWEVTYELLHTILGSKAGRRGELALRNILEGKALKDTKGKLAETERKVTRGAVIASRGLLSMDAGKAGSILATLVSSLRAAQSTCRIIGDNRLAERQGWQFVDYEILALLQDHLSQLESAEEDITSDRWTEGDVACELLRGMIPVASGVKYVPCLRPLTVFSVDVLLAAAFQSTLHQVPAAVGWRRTSTGSSPPFFHPKYIDLLLQLAPHLDEDDANIVVDYYQRECLCLPFTANWIMNIWKLLEAFCLSGTNFPAARKNVAGLLFNDIYGYAEYLPEHRTELVERVIVPFVERILIDEKDDNLFNDALAVLIKAVVSETRERDDEYRQSRASSSNEVLDEEEAAALPSQALKDAVARGSFSAILSLIINVASQTPCKDEGSNDLFRHISGRATSKTRDAASALRGLMSPSKEVPPVRSPTMAETELAIATTSHAVHSECRSIRAVNALIASFTRLAFASANTFHASKAKRTPLSLRSITIFRDLLGLLYPMNDDNPTASASLVKVPARCPRARIVILQWLCRLRADSSHHIYLRADIDGPASYYAAILKRTSESEIEARGETDDAKRRGSRMARLDGSDERGRATAPKDEMTRSPSRSRQTAAIWGADGTSVPLWRIPDILDTEVPHENQSSESLMTYDPNHPLLKEKDSPLVEAVWLPVSEYIRVLNGILRGHDWELVSYVLCFLPLQLSNKLFFHGRRATKELRALHDVLCGGVLGSSAGSSWEKRFDHPAFIRKVDINAAAYQSLSILISYRGVFTSYECERLVQAFMAGLQGKSEVAKPCLQALTLCIYELPTHIVRHLTTIIDSMKNILSTTGLAVHILEFLLALGQNGTIFRNFTEDQYRLVFVVAINYIAEHNARSDQTVDLTVPSSRESFTLSQHVIGLAYYAIYIWFMALKLHQRPNLVPEIIREVLNGRSQRVIVDEMAEVCFDWLARYTYGNADPRPSTSFLSEMVIQEGAGDAPAKSQSWLLGGGIITITSHERTGWATITNTRPTGSTTIVSKLENVPLLELGEANADLTSLPSFLMANRPRSLDPEEIDAKAIASAKSEIVSLEHFDPNSQHGYIWSGATPSQRRKDVVVEPSFLGLQLLSSYPNASLDVPRGRLIPNEDKYLRALRGMQNTPVIDALKMAILYVGPGQTTEREILGNIDGSPLFLDFLSGIGRIIRLKGQVDVFVGGLDCSADADGEYAYAWWDDLSQMIFHIPTMMPNLPNYPGHENKKRLVGNDYVKIVYNDSGRDFAFDTIKTSFNLINIVISPHTTGAGNFEVPPDEEWSDWDREDWFKVTLQRTPDIPDFSPIGPHKLVSRRSLPIVVRQIAHLANDMAARFTHIRAAKDATEAEYITSWRARLRILARLRANLPPVELPDESDPTSRELLIRDFTRTFSYRPTSRDQE